VPCSSRVRLRSGGSELCSSSSLLPDAGVCRRSVTASGSTIRTGRRRALPDARAEQGAVPGRAPFPPSTLPPSAAAFSSFRRFSNCSPVVCSSCSSLAMDPESDLQQETQ